jgi:hypothetical protein
MRLFNQLVFDQIVRGTSEVVSPSDFNDLLGSAYDLTYEVEVEEASGTSPTISVRHLHSCSGKGFIGMANLITTAGLGSLPFRDVKTQSGPFAGLGQVGVTLGGTNPVARVRIWATGRSK